MALTDENEAGSDEDEDEDAEDSKVTNLNHSEEGQKTQDAVNGKRPQIVYYCIFVTLILYILILWSCMDDCSVNKLCVQWHYYILLSETGESTGPAPTHTEYNETEDETGVATRSKHKRQAPLIEDAVIGEYSNRWHDLMTRLSKLDRLGFNCLMI